MDVSQELGAIEEVLEQALATDVPLLSEASKLVIHAGGKRLRPRVLLLSYQAAGGADASEALPLAAAVELLHTATLVHDDINDRSGLRRGHQTVNARWGDSLALLTGDFLFVRLLKQIAPMGYDVIRVLADCCTAIVEGETRHMFAPGNDPMSDEYYLQTIRQKTAALFSASAELGGIAAKATEPQVAALRDYGLNLGLAFQIRDDTLDLVGESAAMGKPANLDLEQGKVSLAPLFALRQSAEACEVLSSGDASQVIELLRDTGAIAHAMQAAEGYATRGKDALAVLPPSRAREGLCELADFAVNRNR